jgi:hypothetical protein
MMAADGAAAVLAGLIETVRLMRSNSLATGAVLAAADYDAGLGHLIEASVFIISGGNEYDSFTNPIDRIARGLS